MSDRVVSLLRTGVPIVWGALLAWVAGRLPLPHVVLVFLHSETGAVTGAAILLWYSAWRWLEKRLPAPLVRLVLGSARTPNYATSASALVNNGGALVNLPTPATFSVAGGRVTLTPGSTSATSTAAATVAVPPQKPATPAS